MDTSMEDFGGSQVLPSSPDQLTQRDPATAPISKKRSLFSVESPSKLLRKQTSNIPEEEIEAKEQILIARNALVDAASLLQGNPAKLNQVLDLLQVFREFLEEGTLAKSRRTANLVLEAKIENLEKITRQSITNTRQNKQSDPKPQQKQNHEIQATSNRSYAQMAMSSISGNLPNQETSPKWTTVQRKPNSIPKSNRPNNTLIISLTDKETPINPLELRNEINERGKKKGFQDILVTAVLKSQRNNLVLNCFSEKAKEFISKNMDILQKAHPDRIITDKSWFKVVIHGIPTREFNNQRGPGLIQEELEIFNNLKIVGKPIWLSSEENRNAKLAGSILVAFEDEEQAIRAIKGHVYIARTSVKVEKAKERPNRPPPKTTV
nr:hypothetical protein CFP56_78952 [Quercus suber]